MWVGLGTASAWPCTLCLSASSTLAANNTLLSWPLIRTKYHPTYPSFNTSSPKWHSYRHQLKTPLQMDSHAQFTNSLGKPSIWSRLSMVQFGVGSSTFDPNPCAEPGPKPPGSGSVGPVHS